MLQKDNTKSMEETHACYLLFVSHIYHDHYLHKSSL